jgi:hypothetical protein
MAADTGGIMPIFLTNLLLIMWVTFLLRCLMEPDDEPVIEPVTEPVPVDLPPAKPGRSWEFVGAIEFLEEI